MLLLWLIVADVSAPSPDWATSCEARLRAAAHAYSDGDPWFDLWWKFRVRGDFIEVRYTADVDICGVYDDFRIRLPHKGRASIQKLHDDGGDFAEFKRRFSPVLKACSGEDDEQQGGEQSGPGIAKHVGSPRTSRATQ